MSRLKKLFLNYLHVNKEFLLPVTDLLDASPCLQEFRLKVSELTDSSMIYFIRLFKVCTFLLFDEVGPLSRTLKENVHTRG